MKKTTVIDEKRHPETDQHMHNLQDKYAQLQQQNEELYFTLTKTKRHD